MSNKAKLHTIQAVLHGIMMVISLQFYAVSENPLAFIGAMCFLISTIIYGFLASFTKN